MQLSRGMICIAIKGMLHQHGFPIAKFPPVDGQDGLFCELPDHQFTLRNGFGGGMEAGPARMTIGDWSTLVRKLDYWWNWSGSNALRSAGSITFSPSAAMSADIVRASDDILRRSGRRQLEASRKVARLGQYRG